jgi:hypothetical protein
MNISCSGLIVHPVKRIEYDFKQMKRYLVVLLLFCLHGVYAQVEFKAVPEKTTMGINETIKVDFIMNEDGDDFNPPTFKGFTVNGPMQSINNIWINKKQTYNKIYSYYLTPTTRGTFTIGQASIEIRKKVYKTIPFKITVTGAVQNGNSAGIPNNPSAGQLKRALTNVHFVAEVSNPNPYVNEAVSVTYKIYVHPDTGVRSWDKSDNPQYTDFWSQVEDIPKNSQKVEKGMYKGEMYNYVVIRKGVLYPQKTGRIELDPMSVSLVVEVPTGRVDIFGNDAFNLERKIISTSTTAINVKPLPEQGRPANFSGAVGSFTFAANSSKTTLANGESLKLDVSVTGKGNLKLFKLPKAKIPGTFEVFGPEHQENVAVPLSGMEGSLSDSYTLVPKAKGKQTIKGLSFSWFDPKLRSYRTMSFDDIQVDVLNVPVASAGGDETASGQPSGGRTEGPTEPFRFIAEKTTLHATGSNGFLGSALFYILLLVPVILVPVIIFTKKKKEAIAGDVKGNKAKETNKLAKKYLAEAKKHLGDKEPFYMHLEKALHNFLKAKLGIESSEMTRNNVRELLLSRNAKHDTVDAFMKIMDNCEFARYAPSSGAAMQQDYDNAVEVVTALEKQV